MAFQTARFAAAVAPGVLALALTVGAQSRVTCDADNGGLKLPPGFCALAICTSRIRRRSSVSR